MPHQTHHIFFSYSRADNEKPKDGSSAGWITAFHNRLQAQHLKYTGRELKIFFDTQEIDHGSDWRIRLGQGLRTSKLFLAFLSPNYMRSKNCRWEWEEYLRREHSLARGDDGIRTIFFELVPGIPGLNKMHADEQKAVQSLEGELRADQQIARWLDMITDEFRRRNNYLHQNEKENPRAAFDWRPWFSKGPQILAELDAADRLEELRQNPHQDEDKILKLSDSIQEIDEHIATRLDRTLLADLAPGRYSLGRTYPHFVGRHKELRELHQSLISDKVGVVTAVHGLGGQGKTALAIQYAHAYADFYAAGGRWLIPCEGIRSISEAMMRLAGQVELRFEIPADLQSDPAQTIGLVLLELERFMDRKAQQLKKGLSENSERMSSEVNLPRIEPRALVILDNVDNPELVSAEQLSLLPQSEWFELVITTRLDPERFGIGKDLRPISVDSLPIDDAVALVRDFQPNQQFPTEVYETGIRRLCEELGCFTLAVELVGAFLAEHPEISPNDYCNRLVQEGLSTSDGLINEEGVSASVRHREKQLSMVVDWTLSRLDERVRFVLNHASLLEPDSVLADWLREIAAKRYPELRDQDAVREKAISQLKFILQTADGAESEQSFVHLLDDRNHSTQFVEMMRSQLESFPQEVREALGPILDDASLPPKDRSKPDEWSTVWKQLSGLRLLTEGEEGPVIKEEEVRSGFRIPPVAKIHRLVASHAASRMNAAESNEAIGRVTEVLDLTLESFDAAWQHDPSVLWLMRPMGDNVLHLAKRFPGNRSFAIGCGRVGQSEITLGSLDKGGRLISTACEKLHGLYRANPNSAQALGDLSVSLEKLGDFYLARGMSGDAELALSQFEESHRMLKQIAEANPNSAQALSNLSVSLVKLGDFCLARGMSGDAELALSQFEESHRMLKQIAEANPNSAQARRDLSVSLTKLGDFYLARGKSGDAELALVQFEESIDIAKLIAEANPNSAQALRDLSVSLDRLGDFYRARGKSGDAELALVQFAKSQRIREQIAEANPNSVLALRDLSVSLEKLGDFHLARGKSGDAELALGHFDESLRIRKQIAEANPNSVLALRALSVSLEKLGDFCFARGKPGDAELALSQFEESHRMLKQIAEANPNSAQARRDLSVSLTKLGDFYLARGKSGDAELALSQFEESHRMLKQIAEANPKSAQALRDLSVSLNKIGDFYLASGKPGDAELALGHFDESLRIRKQIAEANRNSAQALRDLSVSLEKLGDFCLERGKSGDAELALGHFDESLRIRKQIAEANRNSAQALRDLSVSLNRLGDFYRARGNPGDVELALVQFEESLDIAKQIAEANPNSAQALRDLNASIERLGDFYIARGMSGDAELALGKFEESHRILKQIAEANPNSAQALRDLSVSLSKLGDFYLARSMSGDAELALSQFEESHRMLKQIAEANPNSAQTLRDLSVSLQRMSDVIGRQEKENSSREALGLQIEALQISLTLHESNPSSLFFGKTAAITAIRAFQKAQTAGSTDVAGQCLSACYSVLQRLKSNDCEFDQWMEQTYQQLHEVLAQQDKSEGG